MSEWTIPPIEAGMRLLPFLKGKLGAAHSQKHIKRLLDQNQCSVNGRIERFASYVVAAGDHIVLKEATRATSFAFERSRLLYEDEMLLAYDKPAGIACDQKNMETLIQTYAPSARLVHRLDRETTGVLLLAKSASGQHALEKLFKERKIKKTYHAIVDGIPKKQKGRIENFLGKVGTFAGQTLWGEVEASKGLVAITEWQVEVKGKDASLVCCHPQTGRTHQLRVHLSQMGHPILGDGQYGKKFRCAYHPGRYLLHATAVQFPHPISQKPLCIEAPLPLDFFDAQKALLLH